MSNNFHDEPECFCEECEMTRKELEQIETMCSYYSVNNTTELIMALADHVERLQKQAQASSLRAVRLRSPREG